MVSGNFRETLFPLLSQTELDREVTFAVMRYFRKYPYRPAGTVLRQTVIDWEKQDWEYAAIAAASLESYPEMETVKALLVGVQSDNWYVRDQCFRFAAAADEAAGHSGNDPAAEGFLRPGHAALQGAERRTASAG